MRVQVRDRDERGAIALMVSLLAVVLLVISAFTVDFGMVYKTKRQLSTAADAASLAADAVYKKDYAGVCSAAGLTAQTTVRTAAEAAADDLFMQNYPEGTAADGAISDVKCAGAGVEVTYTASGKSNSPLGGLVSGSDTITTGGTAAASYTVGAGICALCVIGDVNAGNADLTVTGGDIYVNGLVNVQPNSTWTATNSITIAGTVSGLSQSKATPDWKPGPPITDPFAGVTLPTAPWTGLTTKAANTSPCGGGPGIYGAFSLPNSTCVLQAGAYVITGAWDAKNNTVLTSNGQPVTMFFAGPNGMLDLKNGNMNNLVAPTTAPLPGWPAGFAIIYARDNTNNLELQGNGDTTPDVIGTVYAVKAKIAFNGNSCFRVSRGPIINGGITGNGNKGCVVLEDTANAGAGTPTGLHLTK